MLLDTAKDPLLFSVLHFKHPKQPHTVQVKESPKYHISGLMWPFFFAQVFTGSNVM